jgi:hypothetical protein
LNLARPYIRRSRNFTLGVIYWSRRFIAVSGGLSIHSLALRKQYGTSYIHVGDEAQMENFSPIIAWMARCYTPYRRRTARVGKEMADGDT